MWNDETLKQRIGELRDSTEFKNYQYVHERVLRMKELESGRRTGIYEPSEYWLEELSNFDYMLDASPLIIAKLRHHCYHITGLRVYDYRSNRHETQATFEAKLRALVELGGKDLVVPEPRILGGFGFDIDGQLFNIDTLKFYEAIIALQRGSVLGEFRNGDERKVVWEIGAGWGGFAYQFKSLCPNVTYIITDFPELFIYSGVYLMTAFPQARFLFYGDGDSENILDRWREVDFIFIPNAFLDAVAPERLDLSVNMVSFQEMTEQQVEAYVQRAFELKCPYLYSLNRDRSPYNTQLTNVRSILDRYYWPHEISVLPVSYTKMLNSAAKAQKEKKTKEGRKGEPSSFDYRHVIGWRRLRV